MTATTLPSTRRRTVATGGSIPPLPLPLLLAMTHPRTSFRQTSRTPLKEVMIEAGVQVPLAPPPPVSSHLSSRIPHSHLISVQGGPTRSTAGGPSGQWSTTRSSRFPQTAHSSGQKTSTHLHPRQHSLLLLSHLNYRRTTRSRSSGRRMKTRKIMETQRPPVIQALSCLQRKSQMRPTDQLHLTTGKGRGGCWQTRSCPHWQLHSGGTAQRLRAVQDLQGHVQGAPRRPVPVVQQLGQPGAAHTRAGGGVQTGGRRDLRLQGLGGGRRSLLSAPHQADLTPETTTQHPVQCSVV